MILHLPTLGCCMDLLNPCSCSFACFCAQFCELRAVYSRYTIFFDPKSYFKHLVMPLLIIVYSFRCARNLYFIRISSVLVFISLPVESASAPPSHIFDLQILAPYYIAVACCGYCCCRCGCSIVFFLLHGRCRWGGGKRSWSGTRSRLQYFPPKCFDLIPNNPDWFMASQPGTTPKTPKNATKTSIYR